eukprot:jgi/Astpho2/8514/Aster-05553
MISLGISFWACYFVDWVVFSVITAAEALITTFFSYVPLYYEGKLLLLVWMMAPQTKGAQYLFDHYISPFLKLHAAKLDPVFASTNIVISSAQMGQVLRLAEKYGASATDQAIAQAALALQQGNATGQKGRTPPASYPAPQQQPQRGQPQQYAQPQSNYTQSQYPARAQEHSEFPSVPRW